MSSNEQALFAMMQAMGYSHCLCITAPVQLDLFTDYEALKAQQKAAEEAQAKERRMQETLLNIKSKFGKNSILRGLNLEEGATALERNKQIGGHKV